MTDLETIAKDWLDKHWESSGPKAQWSEAAWDKYHAQLGLLIAFSQDVIDAYFSKNGPPSLETAFRCKQCDGDGIDVVSVGGNLTFPECPRCKGTGREPIVENTAPHHEA